LKKSSENISKEIIEKLMLNNITSDTKYDNEYYEDDEDEYYEDDEEYYEDDGEYEENEYYEDEEENYFNILKNKHQEENKINMPKSEISKPISIAENYEDSNLVIKMFMMIIILFLVFVVVFVVFKNNNLNTKLSDIEKRLAEESIPYYEEKISELNFKILKLTEENDKLKSQLKANNKINNESNEENISNEYVVQKGDSVWEISKKVYGSAEYYYKILEANGLNEKSPLKLGQKLIIPML